VIENKLKVAYKLLFETHNVRLDQNVSCSVAGTSPLWVRFTHLLY